MQPKNKIKRFWNYKFFDKEGKKAKLEAEILRKLPENIKVKIEEMPKENIGTETEIVVFEPYETFKVHDLVNMFPFNITPALIESKIQHVIAMKQNLFNKIMTPQFVLMFIMILITVILGAILIWKFMGGGVPEVKITLGPGLQGTNIVANLTG